MRQSEDGTQGSGLCLVLAPWDQVLPRILGGLRRPEGGREKHKKKGAASACCPTRCVTSGRAVPSLDVRFSFHLLEVL